ncbi:diphthamide synthesis protein [Candidatus Woesearchaeota archaeon]|nr:diphthamide synthesis protein [Candidatus Woesearchaeota archaeon]
MKKIFIEARVKGQNKIPEELISKLPQRVALFSTVQFLNSLDDVKKQLMDAGKKVVVVKGRHAKYCGQILGCSVDKVDGVDCFLYIGDGGFHPIALKLKNEKQVFVYNPFSKKYKELEDEMVDWVKKRIKGARLKFLTSKEIGVLVSVKPGQQFLKSALGLRNKYPDKNFYFLMFDTIDFGSLEDFPFVEMFVNTACPRIIDDADKFRKPLINIEDLS